MDFLSQGDSEGIRNKGSTEGYSQGGQALVSTWAPQVVLNSLVLLGLVF